VLKPELVVEFEAAWAELRQRRGEQLARPQLAYHGTAESNINSILEKGLLSSYPFFFSPPPFQIHFQ